MKYFIPLLVFLLVAGTVPLHADLSDGLQLHYTFDSISGPMVHDSSGNAHTGTVVGTVATVDGVNGRGFSFNGSTYIDAGNILGLTGATTQMTVSLWFNMPVSASPGTVLISKWMDVSPATGWVVENLSSADRICSGVIATYPAQKSLVYTDDSVELNDGIWHHLCTTFDVTPTSMVSRIFIDGSGAGTFLGEATYIGAHASVDNAAIPLVVGGRNGPHWNFDGILDDVRIYNRILTAQEIAGLYANVPSGSGPALSYICQIGFSNDPEGDQDVTEYYNDETLYISVWDVDLDQYDPNTRVTAHLVQRGPVAGRRRSEKRIMLERQESGIYTGSIPLDPFRQGDALVMIQASNSGRLISSRHSIIRIMSAGAE